MENLMPQYASRGLLPLIITSAFLLFPFSSAEAGDSCAAVKTMIRKLNATSKVHINVRVVNNGFGYGYLVENILVDTKRFHHSTDGPWSISPRNMTPPDSVSRCESIGQEMVDGMATAMYLYDRSIDQQTDRIRIWISTSSGLPLKSHFKTIVPDNGGERYLTYAYGPDIREPI